MPIDEILNAVSKAKRTKQWMADGGSYIPHAATWLSQERWEDELEITYHKTERKYYQAKDYDYSKDNASAMLEGWVLMSDISKPGGISDEEKIRRMEEMHRKYPTYNWDKHIASIRKRNA